MGQVLHSGQGSEFTLTRRTPSTIHPFSIKPHVQRAERDSALHIEFILPEDLRGTAEARVLCSQHLSELFDTELTAGQRGRLLYHYTPNSANNHYVLSLFDRTLLAQSNTPSSRTGCDPLIAGMLRRGFAVRLLDPDEGHSRQVALHTALAQRDVTVLSLECCPESTHPQITSVLREALRAHPYFYVLDFERLPDRDVLTQSASCVYTLSLLMPGATAETVWRAQQALFEMNGALAGPLKRKAKRGSEAPLPAQPRLSHWGSTYTIADLIPA